MIDAALVVAQSMVPYYSRAIAAMTPLCWDGLGTVGVDKFWRLLVDPVWFASLDPAHRAGVIAHHEVEHLIRRHSCRMEGVHPTLANLAGDLEIDDDAPDGVLPRPPLHEAYGVQRGLLAEEYVVMLNEQAQAHQKCNCSGGSGAGNPLDGEPDAGEAPGVKDDGALLDAVAADVQEAVSRGGHVPDSARIWANARTAPKVFDWRVQLAASLRQSLKTGRDDWSWTRVPRRPRTDIVMPGRVGYVPTVELVVDTSGSMGEETPAVVAGVVQKLGGAVVWTTQHDTVKRARCKSMPREWRGGGGTTLSGALVEAARHQPSAVVVVTDGGTDWPEGPLGVHVVCVCTTQEPVPNWIQTVRVPVQA